MKYPILFICTVLTGIACKQPVEKIQVSTSPITESVYASGVIKSAGQYQVYATVSGLIQKILVAEGDSVKKGDPLFIIQNETAQLNTENAGLTADFATSNRQGERLSELKGAIEVARDKMRLDSVLWIRQRDLWAQQIGSKVELEQRELAYSSSKNSYEAALLRFSDLQKQLDFAAKQAKKLLTISKSMSQDFIVRSQSDGRVYDITKVVGEIVSPQSPLATIGSATDFIAELQVDEFDISRINKGQRVILSLDSYKGQAYEGRVAKIFPFMNERSRTFTIEATFTQAPPVLYPNLTTEANIVLKTKENTVTIPRAYLIQDSLVRVSKTETRRVEIGLKDYQKVEILSGLQAGESILKPE